MSTNPTRRTLATYEAVAEAYRDRHDDRSSVAGGIARFDAALPAGSRVLDVGCGPSERSEPGAGSVSD